MFTLSPQYFLSPTWGNKPREFCQASRPRWNRTWTKRRLRVSIRLPPPPGSWSVWNLGGALPSPPLLIAPRRNQTRPANSLPWTFSLWPKLPPFLDATVGTLAATFQSLLPWDAELTNCTLHLFCTTLFEVPLDSSLNYSDAAVSTKMLCEGTKKILRGTTEPEKPICERALKGKDNETCFYCMHSGRRLVFDFSRPKSKTLKKVLDHQNQVVPRPLFHPCLDALSPFAALEKWASNLATLALPTMA